MANYFMLGGDGKEYGPVTAEQLRQWVAERRANAQTQVRLEGGAWTPVGAVPELNAPAGGFAPMPAPGLPGAPASIYAAPPPGGPHPDQPPELIKRVAGVLAGSSAWLYFTAVMLFISAGLSVFTIVGILFMWAPIWLGVILCKAAGHAKTAARSGQEGDLQEALNQVRFFFKLLGILSIVMFICMAIFGVLSVGALGSSGPALQQALQQMQHN